MPRRDGRQFGAQNIDNTAWVASIIEAEAEAELAAASERAPAGNPLDMNAFLSAMAERAAIALRCALRGETPPRVRR
jgi:hypothetical protein